MTALAESLVINLRDATDVQRVGGKALQLGTMLRAGIQVPDGVVVTTTAFARQQGGQLDADSRAAIHEALTTLGSGPFAVRSSATIEDGTEHSLAGQFITSLGVSAGDVPTAVEQCWASADSAAAQAYLDASGETARVHMAVVIQRQVDATVAGVLFTTDPRHDDGSTIIEASWGLGEAVVSGRIDPDRFRVTSAGVHYASVGTKAERYLGNGCWQPVAESDRLALCLSDVQIKELFELGQRLEQLIGSPQDIEFAYRDDQLYCVQTRPITTVTVDQQRQTLLAELVNDLSAARHAGAGPWALHPIAESLDQPRPLSWSLFEQWFRCDGGYAELYRKAGYHPAPQLNQDPAVRLIAGRPYADLGRMANYLTPNYPFAYDLELLKSNPSAVQQAPTLATGSFSERQAANQVMRSADTTLRNQWASVCSTLEQELAPRVHSDFAERMQQDLTACDNIALADRLAAWSHDAFSQVAPVTLMPGLIVGQIHADLRALIAEHAWDHDAEASAWQVLVGAEADSTLRANATLRDAAHDQSALAAWLESHGHRGPGEYDLAAHRWREQPQAVAQFAAALANGPDPLQQHARAAVEAERLTQTLKQLLPSAVVPQFEALVSAGRRALPWREGGKDLFMLATASLRRLCLLIGQRLGVGDHIFDCTLDEVQACLRGMPIPRERIAQRRHQRDLHHRVTPPSVIDDQALENNLQSPRIEDGTTMSATALASGTATGTITIIDDPLNAGDLPADAIMVCASTDPSWTPLFSQVSALVLEHGGMLSHGAVIARELGLPAVVMNNARTRLQANSRVTVDGDQGQVVIGHHTDTSTVMPPAPPLVGHQERRFNRWAALAALPWSIMILLMFVAPPAWVRDPVWTLTDAVLWPLVAAFGYGWATAIIAGAFGIALPLLQRLATDHQRLVTGKKRAAALRTWARQNPDHSATAEALAAPMQWRLLKAAMVPAGLLLGPLLVILLWFPQRADPIAHAAPIGSAVTISALVDGDFQGDITLQVPAGVTLDALLSPATQQLPPIRTTLEKLRERWAASPSNGDLPWDVQAAAQASRQTMLASLDGYLAEAVPPQRLTWLVSADEAGRLPCVISTGDEAIELPIVVGRAAAPDLRTAPAGTGQHTPVIGAGTIHEAVATYPPATTKVHLWQPLAWAGWGWDAGWLGIYVAAYLLVFFIVKAALRVP